MGFNYGDRKGPIVCIHIQLCKPARLSINRVLLVVEGKEVPNLSLIGIWAFEFDDAVCVGTMDGPPISLAVFA
jgi:hypothetical protein